jgi:hypothetical protein
VGTGGPAFRRLAATAILLLCAALAVYAGLRTIYGSRPVYVHVRWAAATEQELRRELEERFSLADGVRLEGETWGYVLTDVSTDNIGGLISDPAVQDTHQLHRTAYRPGYLVPRLPYPATYPWIPAAMEMGALILAALSLLAFGAVAVESLSPASARGPVPALRHALLHPIAALRAAASTLAQWIESRIPIASPESAALFRVLFGLALLAIVLQRPVDPAWADTPANALSPVHRALVRLFAGQSGIANALAPWIAVCGALFIGGLFTRTAFALTTLGVLAWAVLYTTRTTYHTISAMLVALLCLQGVRWGDAWSVDAWRRRSTGLKLAPARAYGYVTWLPGFVLGLIFFAAAFAKLRDSGLAWILNGTVKYHFLSDSRQAMVDWGLQLGRHHGVAVVLSFGAIAIESLVIAGALSQRYSFRFLAGAASLALLSGFTLLQGLFWPGWWILLLSFLPWHLVGRPASGAAVPVAALRAPAAVALALIVVQLGVSLTRLEVSPFLSTYDMYATTYASPAEYEQKSADTFWLGATDGSGVRRQCRISRREADVITGLATASDPDRIRDEAIRRCFGEATHMTDMAVEGSRVRVDWDRWRPLEPVRVRIEEQVQPGR